MKLIVIEGVDGSGKSTQSKMLYERLRDEGYDTKLYSFPSKSSIGRFTRDLLNSREFDELSPESKVLLIGADIYNAIREVEKYQGILITDRYWYSGLAAQIPEGVDEGWITSVFQDLPVPDIIFYLDCSPEKIIKRNCVDYYAKDMERQILKRKVYLDLDGRFQNFTTIDASKSESEVHEEIYRHIKSLYT